MLISVRLPVIYYLLHQARHRCCIIFLFALKHKFGVLRGKKKAETRVTWLQITVKDGQAEVSRMAHHQVYDCSPLMAVNGVEIDAQIA